MALASESGKSIINAVALVHMYAELHLIQTFKAHHFSVTPEQFFILYLLYQNGDEGLYQRQLSKKLLKDRANITRLLNILEKKELLYRKNDETNKRIRMVYLSPSGKEKVEFILPYLIDFDTYINNSITEKECDILKKILDKVLSSIESKVTLQI